jgi:hypothetical protein
MLKHVGLENLERINKNPLLPSAFFGLFTDDLLLWLSHFKHSIPIGLVKDLVPFPFL